MNTREALTLLRDRPVVEVALAFGLKEGHKGYGPCPICGYSTRDSKGDRRAPLKISGPSWTCLRGSCDAGGNGPALVAALVLEACTFSGRDARAVVGAAVAAGLLPPEADEAPQGRERARERVATVRDANARSEVSRGSAGRQVAPPPRSEVRHVLSQCVRPDEHEVVGNWLQGRGLNASKLSGRGLIGALRGDDLPGWARWGSGERAPSFLRGWLGILPTWHPGGEIVGVRARWVLPEDAPRNVKSLGGTGVTSANSVIADPVGRELLRRGLDLRPGGEVLGGAARWTGRILFVEGEPDFLRACGAPAGGVHAVIGVWSGGWNADFAGRVHGDARATIATDDDKAGDRFARQIASSLACQCHRMRATQQSAAPG